VLALPSLGEAFAANSGTDDLTVIDTAGAGAPIALAPTVATGDVPDAIAVAPDQQTVVVSNEGEGTVSIFHVNQPPTNTLPGAQSLVYNASAAIHHTIVFSAAAGRQISTSDADGAASASPLKVTLSVAHGTLTLAQTTNLTFLAGANGQASMTFTGLQADVNAALNGLAYEPTSVFFGSDALALTVDDQGGSGLGKPQTASSSLAITVTDTAPTDIALSPASVAENQPVATTVGTLSASDPDAGDTQSFSLVAGPGSTDNGSFQLVGSTLQTNAVFNFESKASYSIRVRSSDAGGLSVEKVLTVTVNNVNEAPVNTVSGALSVNEDTALNFTGANAVSVADVDVGGGAIQIQLSITNGTLTMTTLTGLSFSVGDGSADAAMTFTGTLAAVNTALATLRYDPTLNFPGAAASGTAAFSITSNDQGNTGSGGALSDTDGSTVTVNQVNDPPVGGGDSGQTVGNVQLFYDLAPGAGVVGTTKTTASTNGLLDNDSDPVEGSPVSVAGVVGCADAATPFDCSSANGGSITVNSNGRFSFRPAAGSTAADSFQYILTDNGTPIAQNVNVTVSLTFVGGRIWFVKNNQAAGGLGRSHDPFATLVAAQTAANAANDRVFVYAGDGTTSGQNAGFTFANNNQTLQGEAVALTTGTTVNGINNQTLVPAGAQPLIGNAAGIGVTFTNRIGTTVTGLSIAGSTKAVEMTTSAAATGTNTITGNTIRGAGAEGIDININALTTGTVTLAITNNTWNTAGTHTGNAIDVNHVTGAGTLNLNLSGNTNVLSTGGAGIVIAGGAVANTTITGFAGNSVHGNTAGAGVNISNVTFDSDPGVVGFQQVNGGSLPIGASGNPVGGAGLAVTTSQGNLFFGSLNIFAAAGTGLQLSGPNLTFGVTPATPDGVGTSSIDADNGAGADITSATIDLRLADFHSDTSVGGLSLSSVGGQFRAPTGSSITKASGAGTAFSVANSVSGATVTYGGTLNVSSGVGVSLTNNTGSTISFTGGVTLSTGTNAAFTATGGGTVNVNNTSGVNTLTTTTGTALNVGNTTIGSIGLKFRSISAGTAAGSAGDGIILDSTGSSGGLTVIGNGSAGTGGTIQHKTGTNGSTTSGIGIYLNSTSNVSLSYMQLNDSDNFAIRGTSATAVTFANSTIDGVNGNDGGSDEGSVIFDGLFGTSSFSGDTIKGGIEDNFRIINTSGTSNVTITGSTIRDTSTTSSGNDNLNIRAHGSASITAHATNNTFAATNGDHLQTIADEQSSLTIVATGNTLSGGGGGSALGEGITISGGTAAPSDSTETVRFNISNNTMNGTIQGGAININEGSGNGNWQGQVSTNTIGTAGSSCSGASQSSGVRLENHSKGTLTGIVSSNTIHQTCGAGGGLSLSAGDNTASGLGNGPLNATVTGNTIDTPGANFDHGVVLVGGGGVSGNTNQICLDMKNNTSEGSHVVGSSGFAYRIRQRFSQTVFLPGYGGANNDNSAVATYFANRPNTAIAGDGGTYSITNTVGLGPPNGPGGGFVNTPGGAQCTQPSVPS
jgi:hypothetical protein